MKKRQSEMIHFIKRMKERFNILINEDEYKKLKSMIGSNDAIFIEKESHSRYHYYLNYNNNKIRVVYNVKTRSLITAIKE